MYPSEMKKFIEDRNGKLTSEEINIIVDTRKNPQLDHISYNPWDSSYDMWDTEGNHFHFVHI